MTVSGEKNHVIVKKVKLMKKKYLIFGGSFNPPHIAHLQLAKYVKDIYRFDRVIFMPAYKSPWGKELVKWEHRVAMLRLSLHDLGYEDMIISYNEIGYGLVGRTYDSLTLFFRDNPDIADSWVYYLIGMDQANVINKWYRYEDLLDMIPFMVAYRPGIPYDTTNIWVNNPPHMTIPSYHRSTENISSTKVREQIRSGKEVTDLTENTLKYIKEHELYV